MKKLLIIISILLLPIVSFAAPTVGTFTYVAGSGGSPQTINTHDHTSGQLLMVFAGGASGNITSITWAGTPLIQISSTTCGDGAVAIYALDDATPGGTQDLVITNSVAGSPGFGVLTLGTADINSTVATTTACGGATSSSLAVTTTAANSLVLDALQISSGECCTMTVGADQTALRNVSTTGPDGISYEADGAPSAVTMSWTWDGSSRSRAHSVAEVLDGTDASAGGGAVEEQNNDMLEFIKNGAEKVFTSIFPYYKNEKLF